MTVKYTIGSVRHNDCSNKVYQSFITIFKKYSYYAGIMLNAFSDPLCSKLCWHNRLVPITQ